MQVLGLESELELVKAWELVWVSDWEKEWELVL